MAAKLLFCEKIVARFSDSIGVLPVERLPIELRLFALAVMTKPGNGEYAGRLESMVDAGVITDVFGIYAQIGKWMSDPQKASDDVMAWNNERLGLV
ncbi:hypothetical protein KAR91_40345 [Candidatus Pacearchaeota archaeon]|nr:hypothetical protein [Candidatus Pacearchaeota archaeon]